MGFDGSDKISKSKPVREAVIFMDNNDKEVNRKIDNKFCKISNINKNPILEYIIFENNDLRQDGNF